MPLHEYRCECENEREVILPLRDADQPQICECGKVMQRLMSVSSFAMKQTGRGMALDTLNDKHTGMPNKWWKSDAEKVAAAGLEEPSKTIW